MAKSVWWIIGLVVVAYVSYSLGAGNWTLQKRAVL